MRRFLPLILLVFLQSALCAGDFTYSILLTANPESIVADGKSIATISAEVRNPDGNLMPDGTLVNFSASAGAVDSAVQTVAGVARAKLRSSSMSGIAIVTATLATGGAVAQIRVDFVPQGSEFQGESYLMLNSSGYLAYHSERQIVEALDGVRIYHRGLIIEAESAQIDLVSGIVRARYKVGGEPVTITRGGKVIRASQLYYSLSDMEGELITATDGKVERLALHGRVLSTSPIDSHNQSKKFDFAQIEEGGVVVMARGMTIKPGEEMHLRQARVYMEDKKVLSLPLHVLPLRPGGSHQLISFTSAGVRLNVPIYYALTPNSTGAFRLRHQRQSGWGSFGNQPGWSLDLDQEYSSASTRGGIGIDRIVGGEWGVHWNHEQEINSATRMYTYFDSPTHRDLFGSMSMTHSFENSTLGMNLYGSMIKDGADQLNSNVYLQSRPKPILGKYANYSLSARTAYSKSGISEGNNIGYGLQAQLLGNTIALSRKTNLRTSYTVGQDWGGSGAGLTTYVNAGINQRIGASSNFGLTYNYSRDPGIISTLGRHTLGTLGFFAGSSPWRTSFFSTIGLDSDLFSGFGDLYYQVDPNLRLGVIGTYQKFGAADYGDVEFAVGKKIMNQEFTLIYSLDRNALRMQMSGFSF